MAGRARSRRLLAAALALMGSATGVAVHSALAPAATSTPTPVWGTYAQVATKDLASSAARGTVTQSYSTIVLRGALTRGLVDDLHDRRAGLVLLAYEKAAGLNKSEVDELTVSHPTWIARDGKGNLIHPRNIADTALADLTNADYRAWAAAKIADEVDMGTDGAFIDTVGAYFPLEFYTARPVLTGKPVTDAAWRDGSADLISRVKAATGKSVIANGFGLGSGAAYFKSARSADVLIAAADGVQIEGFTRFGDTPPGQFRRAAQWDQDLAFLSLLGARNKTALAYTKAPAWAKTNVLNDLRDYALGSFLLAFAPGKASFGFDDGQRVPVVTSAPAWARALGGPAGARVRAGSAGWSRTFQAGTLTMQVAQAPAVS